VRVMLGRDPRKGNGVGLSRSARASICEEHLATWMEVNEVRAVVHNPVNRQPWFRPRAVLRQLRPCDAPVRPLSELTIDILRSSFGASLAASTRWR
jgi:hypothetical protein